VNGTGSGEGPVLIRLLTPDDGAAFLRLRLQALHDHPEAFGSEHEEWQRFQPEDVAQSLASSSTFALGAFDGELVGIVRCFAGSGLKEQHKAFIQSMYVAPGWRRRGIARRLLKDAIARASRWPAVEEVRLSVSTDMAAARHLYLSAGFRIWGTEQRALKVDGRYIAEDHMVLPLNPAAGATDLHL
jgi:ribosomal protein S18 acetylase RimI-like enzyme